jgi:hypothetical protein
VLTSRRHLLLAVSLGLLVSTGASAAASMSWDGTWLGSLGATAPMTVTIANDKVSGCSFMGTRLPISFNRVTATTVRFGDKNHYSVTLTKTGDTTAAALYHRRNVHKEGTLTKQ